MGKPATSDQKRHFLSSESISKTVLLGNEIEQPLENFHQIPDPMFKKNLLKTLESLRSKFYDFKYTSVDSRAFILSFSPLNSVSINQPENSLKLRITRLEDPDIYKLECEMIESNFFKELARTISASIPDIIESLVTMADS